MAEIDPHVPPVAAAPVRQLSWALPAAICGIILVAGLGGGVALAFQRDPAPSASPAPSSAAASDSTGFNEVAGDTAATASATVDGATLDDRFLTVLRMEGITPSHDGGSTTITDAQGLCILFDRGETPEQVGTLVTAGGLTERQARQFVGASAAAYCPRYVPVVRPYADGH